MYSPGVCGVSETLWSLSKMETNYFSLLILASSLVLAVFMCVYGTKDFVRVNDAQGYLLF